MAEKSCYQCSYQDKRQANPRLQMPLDAATIAKTLGCQTTSVTANWPLIQDELAKHGFTSLNQQIAALATIGVECPSFAPVVERGGRDYYIRMYWLNAVTAKSLGNTTSDSSYVPLRPRQQK